MKKYKNIITMLMLFAVLAVFISQAKADMVNLTTVGSSGTMNGALFYWTDFDSSSTGTGKIDPFMRIQKKGIEEGFNSDAGKFLDVKDSHSIQINDIPTVNKNGVEYKEFLLDIDQANPTLLTIDKLSIYLASSGSLTSLAGLNPIWQLDTGTDNSIEMDSSLNPGNGKGDMFAYIPKSLFNPNIGNYVYLYAKITNGTAGFEEWAIRVVTGDVPPPQSPTPVPGAVVLGMLGLFVAGKKLRKYA